MEHNQYLIPSRMALLLVGYGHQTLTGPEHAELDEWVCTSPANQKVFEAAQEMALRAVQPGPDEQDNDDADEAPERRELMYTAELIIKHLKNTITEQENNYLHEWMERSPANAELLASLPKTANMEFLFNQLRMRLLETHYRENLN
jgi:hypothetical protein